MIGIRSIGTTLSAVVTAALKQQGCRAERITVRPTGHPFDRVTPLSTAQFRWIETHLSAGAEFLIVDEGPGLSGSSFLSAGEALLDAGVPSERITFLGSREPDLNALRAHDAATRWHRFHWRRASANAGHSVQDFPYLGGGSWRTLLLHGHSEWPASWTQMERLKFLSADRRWLFKFEGFGRFGKTALERASCLSEGGFGCEAHYADDGLLRYQFVAARPGKAQDLSVAVLERIAEYCAFRTREFKLPGEPVHHLEEMLRFNLAEEFGGGEGVAELRDANSDESCAFPEIAPDALTTANPVLVDGRMQPHEWLLGGDGIITKTDGCSHGDDHFFPGPTDIAWDLAGAIVEWEMDSPAAEFLVSRYARLSQDNPRSRLPAFLLAYTVFRMGYCKMALEAEAGSAEESRLRHAYEHYRDKVQHQLSFSSQAA